MFSRNNMNQAAFIEKANKIVDRIGIHAFSEEGICDALGNTYIKYASSKEKRNLF